VFLLTIVHRETLSFSDEGARMERVAPGNFCRWWLRLEFTVTLVAIFLTSGSALRGTVERKAPSLSGLEATTKEFW
jgi:hypothetical protein